MSAALAGVRTLLCDADGNLFPSEEPAFDASTTVTNRMLEAFGVERRYSPDELRRQSVGKNFRATAADLAERHGFTLPAADVEAWVATERREVTAHLGTVLAPDERVRGPLTALGERFALAVVSSSALGRLDACFEATGLATLMPAEVRFSAEDSLPVPTSKPDPAVYVHAGEVLGVAGGEALAIEDAVAGVRSAVGAGFPCAGNLLFVPADEREEREAALLDAGAFAVVGSWAELAELLPG